jgi:hypothetical protein
VSDIHKHIIGLLIKAIKMVLGFLARGWELGHWMPPNKQESYSDMINKGCSHSSRHLPPAVTLIISFLIK